MADHDDHNYYTRSNRESQIPDYDVNLAEPSNNTVLPSFSYQRQSRDYSPNRPAPTASFDQNKLNSRSSRALGGSRPAHPDSSPDPHEFYRQYRESFQRRPESVYGQFDISAQSSEPSAAVASSRQQRYSPTAVRTNGYNPTPVSARWNRSVESRKSPSPMGEKTGGRPGNTLPRARGDIQALVNKFNSVRDESPPAPIKVASRSTSANESPTSTSLPTPKSFKTRAAQDARSNVSALGTRPTRDSVTGKIGGGPTVHNPNKPRRPSQITSSALASQSMTNLSPTVAPTLQQPLFGEVLGDGPSLTSIGYGIPGGRRRGSDGNLNRSSTIFHDEIDSSFPMVDHAALQSAWYSDAAPSLDGINLDQPIPAKKSGHRRSRSDMGLLPLTLASHSTGSGRSLTILSPPQELPTPSPIDDNKTPLQTRVPITARRPSITSESENSSGYRTPTRSGASLPLSSRNSRSSIHSTPRTSQPRRSPRYRNPSPPKASPNVTAFVADSSAPLRSPPLRSSRPRISVAEASTVASRARKTTQHSDNEHSRPPSKIPNLPPNANMEQRRQMIRRDFTKSWHEKEERQRRQSMYMQNVENAPIPNIPSPSRPVKMQNPTPETFQSSPENTDVFATPAENRSPQPGMTIDTTNMGQSVVGKFDLADSPTLGTADLSLVARQDMDSSPTPGSAATESTSDTSLDQGLRNSEIERQIRAQIDASSRETPRLGLLSPGSDFGDGESIEIMLGEDSPALERRFLPTLDSLRTPIPLTPNPKIRSGDKVSPFQHQDNSKPDPINVSTSSGHHGVPWSPTANLSGATNQDRESGNSIEALLDTYQESEPRRLFSQSPGLARAGGWDNSKVTRMYLQSRGQTTPDPTDAPPQPQFQFDEDSDILQPTKMQIPPAQTIPRSLSPRVGISGEKDIFTEPGLKTNLKVPLNKVDHRASLSHRDDFVDMSPSMLDWMHNHQSASPVDADAAKARKKLEDAFLPNIPGGGLGIIDMGPDVLPDLPSELPTHGAHISELHSSPPKKQESATEPIPVNELHSSPSRRAEMSAEGSTPPRKPVPVKSHKSLQAVTSDTKSLPGVALPKLKKTSSVPVNGTASVDGPAASSESIARTNGSTSDLPQDEESKRLRRRLNIIKELINTESTYGQDMTVVVDIYKGTCNVVLNSAQDERALFINAPEIAAFSMVFLDSLKSAAKSVYVLPKSKRWRSKRDSSATQESSTEDQSSIHGLDLSDEDRDRRTFIGSAFLDHLQQMERVYTEFLKNSEAANAKLKALQEDDKVKVWLDECCAYAKDLTTAWSLDSLLVKPLQRITKYPLLLKELCDVTPENHPDFTKLDTAAREISGVSKRINEAKRRMEMVERVTQAEKNKKKDEGRINLGKLLERRGDRYKAQQIGLQEQFQDKEYNHISDKFGTHFFKLQIVMRDVEMYIDDVQGWVNKFNGITSAMEDYYNVGSTTYPEIESKWRRFRSSMKDMQGTALVDHVAAVRKYVVDPMATLLKLHDGPQRLMEKRKKRIPDFVKYKTMKDKGEKLDKKTTEYAELFLAVNDTLKDELPRLFEMTSRLVEACLNNFVQLQLQWQSVWKRKMMQAIELSEIPRSSADVVSEFSGDFRYTEAHVLSLGICNGSVLADGTSFLPPLSQASTQVGEASRRPSTTTTIATENSGRIRAASNAPQVQAPIEPPRARGFSGSVANVGPSPMLPSPDLGRPTEGFGLGQHLTINSPRPNQGLRVRASSTASSRSPNTPDVSSFRNAPQTVQTPSYARPSTSTGRSYESIPTYNNDSSRLRSDVDARHQPRDVAPQHVQPTQPPQPIPAVQSMANYRASGIFSSAMPMSDSPQASSPVMEMQSSQDFNVLFLAASVYEFNIDRARREAGYPYLTYVAGEIFDVIAEKGELWLAKNQDDDKNQIGWIWNKHFAKLAS